MAQAPARPWLRILVPALMLGLGVLVFWSVMRNTASQGKHQNQPANQPASQPAATPPVAAQPPATQPEVTAPESPPPTGEPAPSPAASPGAPSDDLLAGLRARDFTGDPAAENFAPIGSLDDPDARLSVEFSPYGAGVRSITLAKHFKTLKHSPDNHVVIQGEKSFAFNGSDGRLERRVLTPLGVEQIEIDGATVSLTGRRREPGRDVVDVPVWRQLAPGSFEAVIVNAAGAEVVRIVRTYELRAARHGFAIHQHVENRTTRPLRINWWQYGPVDFPPDASGYGGDKRRVRFGYLARPALDPGRQLVLSADYATLTRAAILGAIDKETGFWPKGGLQWPRRRSRDQEQQLVWAGMADRYFACAVYPLIDPASRAGNLPGPDKVFHVADAVYNVILNTAEPDQHYVETALQFRSDDHVAPPGGAADLSVGVYAGPLLGRELRADPVPATLGLDGLVVYSFGGPCAWCTFSWMAELLFGLVHALHDYVFHDWALSIVFLVLVVRTILHPVTRWSQIRMARFGKQIQELAPKQKKLQEKYKDDTKKLREEVGKLYREEGVSPAGMLGCLPAFLQTPVWIALYAMLFFMFELRHQPAFYGLFQWISGGNWWFMGDLSEPDRFIPFGKSLFNIPLLGVPFDGINILPIILGIVFYVQQKYLTPPTSATLTPEQEQTQKITKIMMVVMFPLFMWGAPSGLAVYFIANSTLGILESKWIRAHMAKHNLLEPKKKSPAPAGGGGFFARLQAAAEQRRKTLDQARGRGGRTPRRKP